MIATTIWGGLGNQMFVYAMARAMALRNNTEMTFNLHHGFDTDFQFHRKLELGNLNVNWGVKNSIATFDFEGARYFRFISRKIGRNIIAPWYEFCKEKEPAYFQTELVSERYKNIYLEGYWQCEKYFSDFKNEIRKDFEIIVPIREAVKVELSSMLNETDNLVFIGIRRYQECLTTRTGMVLEEDYYNKAIQIMESKLDNPTFVVFTQQPDWAKEHLVAKNPIKYAMPKEGEQSSIEDMYLMRNCRHAIISNSSFYWWGAWLREFNDGIVICPQNFTNRDTPLEEWIKL